MIVVHEGTPGSGKSYDAAVKIADELKRGRKVYTNIRGMGDDNKLGLLCFLVNKSVPEIRENLIFLDENKIQTVFDIATDGSLIVIDELQLFFSNRQWQTEGNKKFNAWCAYHRHRGMDLILISHSIERLDAQVRSMVEWTFRYRKINFLGSMFSNRFMIYVHPQDDINGQPLGKKYGTYKKQYFAIYESYVSKDVKELRFEKGKNVLKHPVFYALPVMLCLLLYVIFGREGTFLNKSKSVLGFSKPVQAAVVKDASPNVQANDLQKSLQSAIDLENEKLNQVNNKTIANSKSASSVSQKDASGNTIALDEKNMSVASFKHIRKGDEITLFEDEKKVGTMRFCPPERQPSRRNPIVKVDEELIIGEAASRYKEYIALERSGKIKYDPMKNIFLPK